MMFTTTQDQDYILSILRETTVMRESQALELLRKLDGGNDDRYVTRCLEQLRHMRKIDLLPDGLFTLKSRWGMPVDEEMLSAIDIMLDLTDIKVHAASAPAAHYKLCFVSEHREGIGSYAVSIVRPGTEAVATALLHNSAHEGRIVIFLLSSLSQAGAIKAVTPHFFAMPCNGGYTYFSGGG